MTDLSGVIDIFRGWEQVATWIQGHNNTDVKDKVYKTIKLKTSSFMNGQFC